MLVRVATQNIPEEWTTCGQNYFVCKYLFIITGKGNIKEILVITQFSESRADVVFKVIPSETKLFSGHSHCVCVCYSYNLLSTLTSCLIDEGFYFRLFSKLESSIDYLENIYSCQSCHTARYNCVHSWWKLCRSQHNTAADEVSARNIVGNVVHFLIMMVHQFIGFEPTIFMSVL